jgi:hypothetical protein
MEAMSAPTATAECELAALQDSHRFMHRLGGPVDVVGYTPEGDRIGVIVVEIDEDEVEVVDNTGTAVRLVATLLPEEE